MIIFVTFLAVMIGLLECIPLFKRNMKKEMYVVVFMLLFAIIFQVSSKFKFFTLKSLIESVLGPIGRALFKEV
ncbi:hypothetical protein CSC2_03720 [Clostridium zeae]|uniref:Holin n=1 Tax=Clostridium zeae TaxID=2759022 RepID=A0ABQ1E530_9CLOT|nr:hypothetical protein [Clostridium zeae]GFZ29846.1 hypothetical protein CSC2_03720 [Clostridium zeae]